MHLRLRKRVMKDALGLVVFEGVCPGMTPKTADYHRQ